MGLSMNKDYHIWVCVLKGKGRCWEKGGERVLDRFREEVKSQRLKNVMVTPNGCSDRHDDGPAVMIDPEDVWFCHVTPKDVPKILDEYVRKGRPLPHLKCPI